MLTPEERREIEEEAARYPDARSACADAMRILQRRRGWISEELIPDIADLLGVPASHVDSVATFYNLIFRRPVGRHVILVCDSISCWIMGYDRIRDHLFSRLGVGFGETTPDGRFTLLPIVCLGACDHAPAMMIDDDLHQDLSPEKIDRALEEYK